MPTDNSPEKLRTLSAHDRRAVERESAHWADIRLISPETRAQLLALYAPPEPAGSRLEGVAKATGAAFLGLALLLFNAHNWEHFAPWTRVAVAAAVLATLHTGAVMSLRTGRDTLGRALALLAAIAFGGGIALVGQAFNLASGSPTPLVVWALGIMPFALLLNSLPLHLMTCALASVWAAWPLLKWGHLPSVPEQSGWFVLVVSGITYAAARFTGRKGLVTASLIPIFTLLVCPTLRMHESCVLIIFAVISGLCLAVSALHAPSDTLRLPWRTCATWTGLIGFTVLGSSHMLDWHHYGHNELPAPGQWVAPGLVLVGFLALILMKTLRRSRADIPYGALAVTAASTGIALAWPWEVLAGVVLANLAHLGLGIWLLRDGARMGRLGGYGQGVLVLLVWAGARYVDFGADAGMLGAALLLAGMGFALFVAARLWKSVKDAPHDMEPHTVPPPPALRALTDRIAAHRWPVLSWTAGLTVAFLVAIAASTALPIIFGERVTMEVRPRDPRDLLRGDYVVLDFAANHPDKIDEDTSGYSYRDRDNAPIYAVLSTDAQGRATVARWTRKRPDSGLFLKGRQTREWANTVEFGIEQFYVTEGRGLALEQQVRSHRLAATVHILPNGTARISALTEM